jgi:hypothetical protein
LKSHFPFTQSQARENQINRNERNIREKPAQRSDFNLSLLKIHKQNNLVKSFAIFIHQQRVAFASEK